MIARAVGWAACAVCAWVLWEQAETTKGSATEQAWRVIDAAETRDGCVDLRTQRIKELAAVTARNDWRRRVTDREFYEINPTGTLETRVRLYCLPSGTDPRPR